MSNNLRYCWMYFLHVPKIVARKPQGSNFAVNATPRILVSCGSCGSVVPDAPERSLSWLTTPQRPEEAATLFQTPQGNYNVIQRSRERFYAGNAVQKAIQSKD